MPSHDVVLRLVTANAASGRDRRGGHDHAAWARAVAEAQERLDADVWVVQEVDHLLPRSGAADQTAEVGTALAGAGRRWESRFVAAVHGTPGSVGGVGPATGTDPVGPSYGIAVHSRHPVRAWQELRLEPSRLRIPVPLPAGSGARVLWVPDEPRVAVAAVVAPPTGEVTVVTTHLSFAPWRARRQLRQVVAWARGLPRPLVLLGDLNLAGRVPARVTGFDAAGSAPTYPAHRPRRRLDHALLHPGEVPPGPTRLHLVDLGTPVLGQSDHRGVAVELRRG